jgi:hypothetical protein
MTPSAVDRWLWSVVNCFAENSSIFAHQIFKAAQGGEIQLIIPVRVGAG